MDKISELQPHQYRNRVIFPKLPDTNITFIILSYGYHLHRAKVLLRRLSRLGFSIGMCPDDVQFDRFVRKRVDIPISTSQTMVMCASEEYDKFYSVREMLNYLAPDHHDVTGMRTICPITNLSSLKALRTLHHPYLFNSFNKSSEQLQIEEVRQLFERDQIEEFQFEMRYSNPEYSKLLTSMKTATHLKRLAITLNLKPDLLDVLNKNIGKDASLKSLAIVFANYN